MHLARNLILYFTKTLLFKLDINTVNKESFVSCSAAEEGANAQNRS